MRLSDFFALDGEYQISAADVQMLNIEFSRASIEDIPPDKVSAVCDYLCTVLLHSAADSEVADELGSLLAALQARNE